MTRRLLILNHASSHRRREAAVEALRQAGGTQLVVTATTEEVLDVVAASDAATVVVGGGDGTIHTVVRALHHVGRLSEVEVGVIPLGTGNDLARSLGLPSDPVEAVAVVTAGHVRRIDIMADPGGSPVVNAAHLGIGAEAARRSEGLKDLLGPAAYPVGAVTAGVRQDGWATCVTVDGDPVVEDTLLAVGIGNGATVGGGTALFPAAVLDDGLLDVVAVRADTSGSRLGLALDARSGDLIDRDDVVTTTGRHVVVEGEPFLVDVDGEISDPVERVEYRIVPGALAVIVPRDGTC